MNLIERKIFRNQYNDEGQRNEDFRELRNSSRTGIEFGLKLTLFLDYVEYIGLLAPNAGARILVHDPRVLPDLQSESFPISAGEATFLAVKMEVVNRMGSPYGDCAKQWPDSLELDETFKKKWPKYTQESCIKKCLSIAIMKKCQCLDTYDSAWVGQCKWHDHGTSMCRKEIYTAFKNRSLTCSCPPSCYTIEYKIDQSRSSWPTKQYSPYFASKMLESESKKVVRYMNALINASRSAEEINKDIRENFVRVEVFYEALNFQLISENAEYDIWDVLTDFGGNSGLWLGWSIFALFELLEFFVRCLEAFVRKRILKE